jgi:hypothetical protein
MVWAMFGLHTLILILFRQNLNGTFEEKPDVLSEYKI